MIAWTPLLFLGGMIRSACLIKSRNRKLTRGSKNDRGQGTRTSWR
jgi:hypothetical protein